ncbi:hypothetical protein BaRGS_00039026, partial [Batillaria attramentaria]
VHESGDSSSTYALEHSGCAREAMRGKQRRWRKSQRNRGKAGHKLQAVLFLDRWVSAAILCSDRNLEAREPRA